MRDFEKQNADWRRSITKALPHRSEAFDELEAHLRDEIDTLIRSGTSPEQAFDLAVCKLGQPSAIDAEFDKLEQLRRPRWKPATLARWACVAIALLTLLFLVPRIGQGRMTLLLASHVLSVTIGYSTMFVIGGLAIYYVLAEGFRRTGPSQRYALGRTILQLGTISAVLTSVGIVLGMIWAKQNWGRYWAWDVKETGGAVVLLCALITVGLARFKPASYRALVPMAIIGNIGTAWGWFGANAGTAFPFLTAFIASQCLLLLAFFGILLRQPEREECR